MDRVLSNAGHPVLVFFQHLDAMSVFEDYLQLRKVLYMRLDGVTPGESRPDLMRKFNAPDSKCSVFMPLTLASAVKFNLHADDMVIIFESDWNPQQDVQAQDRAHRIGQTKQVLVLRLITKDSFEERVWQLASQMAETQRQVDQSFRKKEDRLRALLNGVSSD